MPETTAAVTARIEEPIGTVTLAEPRRRNPLSEQTMREATRLLRELSADERVRVIVIDAEGPAFSAGHDLAEVHGATRERQDQIFQACAELMSVIHQIGQPVIAQVQGMALAAGCQLVATCDLAVAADDARFSTPGVRIGLFCSTPMVPLTRAIGRKRAMEMLLTGEMIDAATAVDWGLINRAVPAGELAGTVHELATRIADASSHTLAIGKRAFYEQIDVTEPEAYRLMTQTMAANAVSCDAQEGIGAFLDKRTPVWTHGRDR
ncbi:putative enoyl-CoA hydratase [Gordonia hirsuta DSM 44140 = NBRC 16056]|uniref:Enoyl-CoA hydratase domain-containing protein 3, mitochondrial n=1 Tax=Gordonia hirsuta DSM 44140 = NBRC 16056 TaxID=1121927 RepID=L7L5N5_9ACTN|nr:enoyl-CoA hydratase [Gordonia hirsuta]GAC56254.1 putative enoyl-CoA hydratase [Gordonia hirsuta DSM 44140 = NBRC 16056]